MHGKKWLLLGALIAAAVLYLPFVIARASSWSAKEVVAGVFAQRNLLPGHDLPFVVPDEDAGLMEKVSALEWCTISKADLVSIATKKNKDWIYLGDIEVIKTSAFRMDVHVSSWPKQVRGAKKIVFLCGGARTITVRKSFWYVLLGVGPEHTFRLTWSVIS